MLNTLAVEETRQINPRILLHTERAIRAVRRSNQPQPIPPLILRKSLLLVARHESAPRGQQPNLIQMNRLAFGRIEFAVHDPRPGRHPLKLARRQHLPVSHRVLVLKRSLQDVGHNLHVPMTVHAKPLTRRNPVLIHHPQRSKSHVSRIDVIRKRKRVIRIQPPVIKMPALAGFSYLQHSVSLQRLHRPSEQIVQACRPKIQSTAASQENWLETSPRSAGKPRSCPRSEALPDNRILGSESYPIRSSLPKKKPPVLPASSLGEERSRQHRGIGGEEAHSIPAAPAPAVLEVCQDSARLAPSACALSSAKSHGQP